MVPPLLAATPLLLVMPAAPFLLHSMLTPHVYRCVTA